MSALAVFFGWPAGGIWSNLLASAVCLPLGWLWARRRFIAELRRRDAAHCANHRITHDLLRSLHQQLGLTEEDP